MRKQKTRVTFKMASTATSDQPKPVESVKENEKKDRKKAFRWTPTMIDHLISCLGNYRTAMEFKGKDFDGDRPAQYAALRKEMTKMFGAEMFGPESSSTISPTEFDSLTEEEKKEERKRMKQREASIKQGYNRILEKIKDIRQRFSNAVVQGSRSGSGKIVMEHYDRLKVIYGGSPSAVSLESGVETDEVNSKDTCQGSDVFGNQNGTEPALEELILDNMPLPCDESSSSSLAASSDESARESMPNKRKASTPIPKLIDNKRKHLEKKLSASQRDAILLNEARDDAALRRDLIYTMKSSNETFTEAMKSVGESMKLLSQSMASSIQILANCLSPQPAFRPHQEMMGNMFQQRSMMDFLDSTQVHKDSNFMVSPRNMTGSGESYTYEQL